MKLLVTGADGFVGGWLARRLLEDGHRVFGTHRPGGGPSHVLTTSEQKAIGWMELELTSPESVEQVCKPRWDGVVHLAAIASGSEAREAPENALKINTGGTARLAGQLGVRVLADQADPLFIVASSAEVYGAGTGKAHKESDALLPVSPYGISKLGAETVTEDIARRTKLRAIVARPFPHTGPGQNQRFVVPALARRLLEAKREGKHTIRAGNLDPVRELLDVRDVAAAYALLLERGAPGETYNIAAGEGHPLSDILERMGTLAGWPVTAEKDPALERKSEIPHLVGDPTKLWSTTGWRPRVSLDQTLQDVLDAEAH